MPVNEEPDGEGLQVDLSKYPYLSSLNAEQLKAVIHPPSTPLQILAGPGSGKTRVLTSRVAYLVQHHGIRPWEITAVTFTNKAANEMRKRLKVLLGETVADNLVLGTFHSTCAGFLRRYGRLIELPNNFSITDSEDGKKIMSGLIKAKSEVLAGSNMSLKDRAVLSEISKAKAKEESPDGMAIRAARDPGTSTNTLAMIAELYGEYEAALREANSLDFDDLLVFGLKLFRTHPHVLATCKHILVDEFQDTNTTQYELMRCFAKAHGGVSVVGDPDQSIYGWRSAEVENLNKMAQDFPGTQAIYLEHNYRSTGSILSAAHSVVSQDRERIPKDLYTSHPRSTPVTLKVFSTPVIEASFIATEIKRLIAYSGGTLNHGDFAILLRYNALSRVLESALQKDSIPNRIVGGHKFFERMEIKDLLAYLQLAENPGFTPAFMRVINVPKRAIGDKSVADILAAAKSQHVTPMELCERISDGDQLPAGIRGTIKKGLATFVGVVRKLRRAADKGLPVADLIRMVIEKTGYEEYLRTSQPDFDSRWENVQELISYSVTVAEEQTREANVGMDTEEGFLPASSAVLEAVVDLNYKEEQESKAKRLHPMFRRTSSSSMSSRSRSVSVNREEGGPKKRRKMNGGGAIKEEPIEVLASDEETDPPVKNASNESGPAALNADEIEDKASMKPLSYFLQTSMLSTDTENSNDDDKSNLKVTLITVHAAKGLEWPVVFIPAVEQGTYPSYRCTESHEVAEERRLLYVAMTRAQGFLTMSHCQYRMMGGEENDKEASEFVTLSQKADPDVFSANLPDVDLAVRRNLAKMLNRPPPDEQNTDDMIRKHIRLAPPLSMWDAPEPRGKGFNRFARREVTKATRAAEYWASEADEYALPGDAYGLSGSPNPQQQGFASARAAAAHHHDRLAKPYKQQDSAPSSPKPVVKIPPRDHRLPEPLPFTFGMDRAAPKASSDLGAFTNSSNDFLADMKNLGLPAVSSGMQKGSSGTGSDSGFDGLGFGLGMQTSGWRDLAQPSSTLITNGATADGGTGGSGVQLAKGTKRLGMGRPAPWGTKK